MRRLTDLDDLMGRITAAGIGLDARTSEIIMTSPTVDAIEITRCIDCRHLRNPETKAKNYCQKWHDRVTKKDGFCWAGSPREQKAEEEEKCD